MRSSVFPLVFLDVNSCMGLPDMLTIFEPKTQRPMNRIRRPKGVVFKPGIHRGKVPKLQFQLSAGLSGTPNNTRLPKNFTLLGLGAGYICSQATIEAPSLSLSSDGR